MTQLVGFNNFDSIETLQKGMADRIAHGKGFLISLIIMSLHSPRGCFTEVNVVMPISQRRN